MCFLPQRRTLFRHSTSKSVPRLKCFVHFDLEMCFAPQRRALFRQLNFQKCSEREVFLAFSLPNVLRATTVCNFSSLIWTDGSAPAALQAYFSTLSRLSYLFTHLHLLSSHSFPCLIFSLLLFSSLTLPTSAFPFVHMFGSLTSKLRSLIIIIIVY